VALKKPEVGCIAVFDRGHGMGHVGFYVGEDEKGIYILGGNQNNSVNISLRDRKSLLGYRWPLPNLTLV
jgi:uncharacterized protein (TIGR02594 family)